MKFFESIGISQFELVLKIADTRLEPVRLVEWDGVGQGDENGSNGQILQCKSLQGVQKLSNTLNRKASVIVFETVRQAA